MTLSAPYLPQTTLFSLFCSAIHSVVTGEHRDFKFGTLIYHSKSHPADEKYSLKGAWSGSGERTVLEFYTPCNFSATANARDFRFCTRVGLSLVMSKCFLSGRGQGHVSNFYIVKGKVFPYSLPSVGPGADPGVQAVSPQVT